MRPAIANTGDFAMRTKRHGERVAIRAGALGPGRAKSVRERAQRGGQ
jgi:hypothetical protein